MLTRDALLAYAHFICIFALASLLVGELLCLRKTLPADLVRRLQAVDRWYGIVAGLVCYAAVTWLKAAWGYDDALDAFGVHAVGGAVGAVLTGVFAVKAYGGTPGWIEGNGLQVISQIKGVLVVAIYDAMVSLIILKLVDIFVGLRVDKEIEIEGLDANLHGETVQ